MRSPPQILLTATLLVAVMAAYHLLLTSTHVPATAGPAAFDDLALKEIEARLTRVEDQLAAPLRLAGTATVEDRLGPLEARLAALEQRGLTHEAAPQLPADGPSPARVAATVDPSSAAPGASLTDAQERRVRDLAERVLRGPEQRRAEVMMDGALRRLDLDLTAEQRQKVEEALLEHRTAERDAMDAARAEGLSREEARDRLRPLEQQFQETLATFLPASDAEVLVHTLTAPPPQSSQTERPPGPPMR